MPWTIMGSDGKGTHTGHGISAGNDQNVLIINDVKNTVKIRLHTSNTNNIKFDALSPVLNGHAPEGQEYILGKPGAVMDEVTYVLPEGNFAILQLNSTGTGNMFVDIETPHRTNINTTERVWWEVGVSS